MGNESSKRPLSKRKQLPRSHESHSRHGSSSDGRDSSMLFPSFSDHDKSTNSDTNSTVSTKQDREADSSIATQETSEILSCASETKPQIQEESSVMRDLHAKIDYSLSWRQNREFEGSQFGEDASNFKRFEHDVSESSLMDLHMDLNENPENWLKPSRKYDTVDGDINPLTPKGDTISNDQLCRASSNGALVSGSLQSAQRMDDVTKMGDADGDAAGDIPENARSIINKYSYSSPKSRYSSERKSRKKKNKTSKIIYVPQDWNSIILFLKGNQLQRISKECHVDIHLSTCSTDCTNREKDILRSEKKRAVHIRGACSEDVDRAVTAIGNIILTLSVPEKPEMSYIRRLSSKTLLCDLDQESEDTATGETIKFDHGCSPVEGESPGTRGSSRIIRRFPLNTSPTRDDCDDEVILPDSQSYVSRKQLRNTHSPVLNIEVQNNHQTLFPFFRGSSDRRGIVVAARSGCSIEVTDRIRRKANGEEKRVLRIRGPTLSALEKCVRLLDMHFENMAARCQFREFKDTYDKRKAAQLHFS